VPSTRAPAGHPITAHHSYTFLKWGLAVWRLDQLGFFYFFGFWVGGPGTSPPSPLKWTSSPPLVATVSIVPWGAESPGSGRMTLICAMLVFSYYDLRTSGTFVRQISTPALCWVFRPKKERKTQKQIGPPWLRNSRLNRDLKIQGFLSVSKRERKRDGPWHSLGKLDSDRPGITRARDADSDQNFWKSRALHEWVIKER